MALKIYMHSRLILMIIRKALEDLELYLEVEVKALSWKE
jgi:hypothetical protein